MNNPDDEEFDIPVRDAGGESAPAQREEAGAPEAAGEPVDWTWTKSVRDDPESLGAEARKLWDAVRSQFVEPLMHNYPEAAGHLSKAGTELASAVRSLIRGSEQLWAGSGQPGGSGAEEADVVEVVEDEAPKAEGPEDGQGPARQD